MAILNWRDHPRLRFVDFPPATTYKGAVFIASDRGDTSWVSDGADWLEVAAPSRHITAINALISAYEAEQAISRVHGTRSWPRPALINADDIPTLTSVSDPATDSDPATQVIYPFGINHAGVVPKEYRKVSVIRGYNPNLKVEKSGRHYVVPSKLVATGTHLTLVGRAGIDTGIQPGQSWAMGSAPKYCSFLLDGDVLFLPSSIPGDYTKMHIMVGESIVTPVITDPAISVGSAGFNFTSAGGTHFIKIKFPTVARRRITLVHEHGYIPDSIVTRATSTLVFREARRPRWLAFGDSFTDQVVSDVSTAWTMTHSYAAVMQAEFGGELDFINVGAAGAAFSKIDTNVLPGDPFPYPNGKYPSFRTQLVTATKDLDPDIITILCGCNDSYNTYTGLPEIDSELRQFIIDARTMHKNALLIVISANTTPLRITSGFGVDTEVKIKTICEELGVVHIPLQTRSPAFMRGNGDVTAPNGSGNCDLFVGPDKIHPNIIGHRSLGQLIAEEIYGVLVGQSYT